MIIDCESCQVRGRRCDGCVVSVVLAQVSTDLPLDAAERRALTTFVGVGLVSPAHAAGLRARREPWGSIRAVG